MEITHGLHYWESVRYKHVRPESRLKTKRGLAVHGNTQRQRKSKEKGATGIVSRHTHRAYPAAPQAFIAVLSVVESDAAV